MWTSTGGTITVESYGMVGKCLTRLAIIFARLESPPCLPTHSYLKQTWLMRSEVGSTQDVNDSTHPSPNDGPVSAPKSHHISEYTVTSEVCHPLMYSPPSSLMSLIRALGWRTRPSHITEMAFIWRSWATVWETLSFSQPLQKWQNARCLGKCTGCNYTLLIAEDLITECLEREHEEQGAHLSRRTSLRKKPKLSWLFSRWKQLLMKWLQNRRKDNRILPIRASWTNYL